jgi:hypothetical protein
MIYYHQLKITIFWDMNMSLVEAPEYKMLFNETWIEKM